jgi:hypothetical protein
MPLISLDQAFATLQPNGDTSPMPVTTILSRALNGMFIFEVFSLQRATVSYFIMIIIL